MVDSLYWGSMYATLMMAGCDHLLDVFSSLGFLLAFALVQFSWPARHHAVHGVRSVQCDMCADGNVSVAKKAGAVQP